MTTRRTSLLVAASLAASGSLAGCAATHGPEEAIASGVYDLTIRSALDDCSPSRLTGSVGEVPVVSQDGLLSVPVPDRDDTPALEVARRVTLLEEEGFHFASVGGMEGCPTATERHAWTVVARSEDTFEVEHCQRFEGLAGCGAMEGAPEADCEAVRDLRFTLRTRCDAPCELTWSPGAGVACTCD